MIPHLHLFLPQTLAWLRADRQAAQATVLDAWLRTGKRTRLWADDDLQFARLDPWQHAFLSIVPDGLRSQGLASASLSRRGAGAEWQSGSCLHMEPVHLAAGLDDLRLMWPPPLTAEERAQLFASLQPLISVAGFELHEDAHSGAWYIWCATQYRWLTYSPRSGYVGRLQEIMPTGDHAAELRRLMTELQMLLHSHPVNQRRQQRGVLPVNSFWFWGDAEVELISEPLQLHVVSDEPYVRGLCEHLHQACWLLPEQLGDILNSAKLFDLARWALVLRRESPAQWAAQWQELDNWLRRGVIQELHVHLDHWRIDLRGGRAAYLWRALRRGQPWDDLLL